MSGSPVCRGDQPKSHSRIVAETGNHNPQSLPRTPYIALGTWDSEEVDIRFGLKDELSKLCGVMHTADPNYQRTNS